MDLFFSPLACSMSVRIALAEAGPPPISSRSHRGKAPGADRRGLSRNQPARVRAGASARRRDPMTENAAILQFIADEHPAAGLAPPASDDLARAKSGSG